jgi:hypothetical protein
MTRTQRNPIVQTFSPHEMLPLWHDTIQALNVSYFWRDP